MNLAVLIAAALGTGILAGGAARRLPPSGVAALALACLPPVAAYYAIAAC